MTLNLSTYSTRQLLDLRDRINELLPSGEIEDVNLSEELVRTSLALKQIIRDADDEEVTLNQYATAYNALTSVFKQLADMQKSLYDVKRAQKLERSLSEALKKFPEVQDAFFASFEEFAGQ
jgi:predicted O-linked N-acetylglucosamine transferase (SPINDLY family)